MTEPAQSATRPVSGRFVAATLVLAVYAVTCLAIMQLQSRLVGLIMLAPLFIAAVVVLLRVPRQKWAQIATAQQQTRVGRFLRWVDLALLFIVVVAALRWLHERL